jgi:hypothetical protein
MFQTYCYWIMSALTNDPRRLARYAGMSIFLSSPGYLLPLFLSISLSQVTTRYLNLKSYRKD